MGKVKTEEEIKREAMKLEIAKEIGVYDKVEAMGWKSLSSKESGRIGGLMAKKARKKTSDS